MSSSRVILWSLSFGCCPPRCLLVVFWRLSAGLFSRNYPLGLSSRSFHLGLTSEVVFCLTSGYCHLGLSSGCCALRLSLDVVLCGWPLSLCIVFVGFSLDVIISYNKILIWVLSSGVVLRVSSSGYWPLDVSLLMSSGCCPLNFSSGCCPLGLSIWLSLSFCPLELSSMCCPLGLYLNGVLWVVFCLPSAALVWMLPSRYYYLRLSSKYHLGIDL